MRVLLTDSNEYLLSPDIAVCSSIEDVYIEVDKAINDNVLYIFVDDLFVDLKVLNQLELYRYEFKTFGIILTKPYSNIINLMDLERECYLTTPATNTATELFLKAERYERDMNSDNLEDIRKGIENRNIMKNMVEYDYSSFKSSIASLLNRSDMLLKQNNVLRDKLQDLIKEKDSLKRDIEKLRVKSLQCEESRVELLSENLKLKYKNYINDIGSKSTATTTPLLYIKTFLPKEENKIIKFFSILNIHLRDKFNVNSTFIVIDDFNTLKFKKIKKGFTYVSSEGKYNMSSLGNQIITTSEHVDSLFENFEKFSGIKDLFIVLDMTNSTKSFVIGDGTYVIITNPNVNNDLYSNLLDTVKVEESELVGSYKGKDALNLRINMTKSDIFNEMEKISMELIN